MAVVGRMDAFDPNTDTADDDYVDYAGGLEKPRLQAFIFG
jgi:hypothetical protein